MKPLKDLGALIAIVGHIGVSAITFSGSWADGLNSGWYEDANGRTWLTGTVTNPGAPPTGGYKIGNIPTAAARSNQQLTLPCAILGGASIVKLQVDTNGDLTLVDPGALWGAANSLVLEGISFTNQDF
jgi:hypothetical protein